MRRCVSVVVTAVLAACLLVPATVAFARPTTTGVVVVAAEGEPEEPVGRSPRGPDDPANTNAPEQYEPPFLINAAVGLTFLLVLTVLGIGGLYWLLVLRPRTSSRA